MSSSRGSSSAGVHRFVLSHGGAAPDVARLAALRREHGVEVLVAGGVTELDVLPRLRDAGVSGVMLGEALLSGAIDFQAAMAAAA